MKRMKALLIRLLASAIALSMLALTGCDGNSAGNNSGSGAGTAAPTQSGETRDDVVIALASERRLGRVRVRQYGLSPDV